MSHRLLPIDSPHTYTEGFTTNVARQCLDYPTRTDFDNITHPWLLEKWEPSEDLKTWDLYLKKGIKWSNGDELVADHVIWNIKRWLDPNTGSSILGLMKAYMMSEDGKSIWDSNAVEKVDDHHVRLNCRSAQLGVPEHLFHYQAYILHPAENGKWGPGGLCTGPFSLTEHVVGKRAVVTRRDGYWGEPAKIEFVEFIDLATIRRRKSPLLPRARSMAVRRLDRAICRAQESSQDHHSFRTDRTDGGGAHADDP